MSGYSLQSRMSVIVLTLHAASLFPTLVHAGDKGKKAEPIRILMLGDSITKGVRPGVKVDETFPFLVEKTLRNDSVECKVTNAGVGGENTSQALARLARVLKEQKPEIVVLMYGTNDSYTDRGKNSTRLTPEAYSTNLLKLVSEIRSTGADVIMMTPPRNGPKHAVDGSGKAPNNALAVFAEKCRSAATMSKTPMVDHFKHWTNLEKNGTNLSAWMTDECHPKLRGQQELTTLLLPVLRETITRRGRR